MSFYLRTQKRHLIICSEAETERQVPNHACDFTEWLCVCARYIFLLGRAIRMLTLWQLLLTGVNTLSTSLYTVSTSLLSVWCKPKWQDGDCRPPGLGLVSYRQSFQYAFDNTLELILNTRPTSFSVLTHRCLWISVLLLNWNISGSNGSTAAISVVVMWNIWCCHFA